MIELLAMAHLRNCIPEVGGNVFGAILPQDVVECSGDYLLVEPQPDTVVQDSCGITITEGFVVEYRRKVEKIDRRGEKNTAFARQIRDELIGTLHRWVPGSEYGLTQYQGGGFSGLANGETRFRFNFSVELKCTDQISVEKQQQWNEIANG